MCILKEIVGIHFWSSSPSCSLWHSKAGLRLWESILTCGHMLGLLSFIPVVRGGVGVIRQRGDVRLHVSRVSSRSCAGVSESLHTFTHFFIVGFERLMDEPDRQTVWNESLQSWMCEFDGRAPHFLCSAPPSVGLTAWTPALFLGLGFLDLQTFRSFLWSASKAGMQRKENLLVLAFQNRCVHQSEIVQLSELYFEFNVKDYISFRMQADAWMLTSYLLVFRCSSSYEEAILISCCFTCCSSLLRCSIRPFAFLHSRLSFSSFIRVSCSCLLRAWYCTWWRTPLKLHRFYLTFLHSLFFPSLVPPPCHPVGSLAGCPAATASCITPCSPSSFCPSFDPRSATSAAVQRVSPSLSRCSEGQPVRCRSIFEKQHLTGFDSTHLHIYSGRNGKLEWNVPSKGKAESSMINIFDQID